MQAPRRLVLLTSLLILSSASAQSDSGPAGLKDELSLLLQPGSLINGLPQGFTFVLTNISNRDLRIPPPDIDCTNATPRGTLWLNESWQPASGIGLGKGSGSCDFGGTTRPPLPILDIAQKWILLRAGESTYITANNTDLHYEFSKPGTYTFSAIYSPPDLSAKAIQDLKQAGITVPTQKALSASIQYRKEESELHAAISAGAGYFGDMRLVSLSFRITNDSDHVLNSQTASWKLMIDGREVPDPGGQLWMGPRPTGGYDIVHPGQSYTFVKALPYSQYFPESREYQVYWKSTVFQSKVVTIRGQATP